MKIEITKVQKYLDWLKTKIFLDSISSNARKRNIKRGEVYRCNLGMGVGYELQKERPCVIVQNNMGNINSGTTIIAPISNTPGISTVCVPIRRSHYKYQNENKYLSGYINLAYVTTVSKSRLSEYITTLTTEMEELDDKILTSIGLYKKHNDLKTKIITDKKHIRKITQENYEMKKVLEQLKYIYLSGILDESMKEVASYQENKELFDKYLSK